MRHVLIKVGRSCLRGHGMLHRYVMEKIGGRSDHHHQHQHGYKMWPRLHSLLH